MSKRHIPFRLDGNNNIIAAATRISDILRIDISSSAWTSVALADGINAKSLLCQLRNSNSAWQLTTTDELEVSATTSVYATLKGTVAMDLAGKEGETLFWVRSSAGAAAPFEVIVLD